MEHFDCEAQMFSLSQVYKICSVEDSWCCGRFDLLKKWRKII